ncbi:prolipoprotein diacylglyceryl transferase [Mycoplasmopsis pullorum]|uniref:Phosphatidylglycerol--prolipoprotein diacylglyceryl transferase n=1 Tax=Mycoplasmopsis pullorum TaxID=48003 RepID=A0A1L4FS02_9BACT|nr:prolipoprotein diacylglyceryl transferase [Mycoplasmopsis pullorum]APJ38397.1 prolipoprotein diacylglyceryl transferase [Mycoplasmopsis pullorum]
MNTINAPWTPDAPIRANESIYLFSICSYNFHVYSLMIMLGILSSILTILFFWYREKYKIEILLTFILIVIPTAIFGARLGYVVEALLYEDNPFANSHWYALWDGGLSIQGGIILAAICCVIYGYTQRNNIDVRKVASIIIPTILVGQFIGRWGNFANHELYGKIDYSGKSSLIFGKSFAQHMFIVDSFSEQLFGKGVGAYRYPLFLYEGFSTLTGYIIIVWIFNLFGVFRPGATSGLYLLYYGIVRTVMEPMRQDSFNLYVIVSLIFASVGALIFMYFQFFSRVKYVRVRKSYYFDYEMKNVDLYQKWVQKSSFSNIINLLLKKKGVENE